MDGVRDSVMDGVSENSGVLVAGEGMLGLGASVVLVLSPVACDRLHPKTETSRITGIRATAFFRIISSSFPEERVISIIRLFWLGNNPSIYTEGKSE
jgi:hypothetical protein